MAPLGEPDAGRPLSARRPLSATRPQSGSRASRPQSGRVSLALAPEPLPPTAEHPEAQAAPEISGPPGRRPSLRVTVPAPRVPSVAHLVPEGGEKAVLGGLSPIASSPSPPRRPPPRPREDGDKLLAPFVKLVSPAPVVAAGARPERSRSVSPDGRVAKRLIQTGARLEL